MGICPEIARALIGVAQSGVRFGRTAAIGRQWLLVSPSELRRIGARLSFSPAGWDHLTTVAQIYADEFLKALGAIDVTSIDACDYEHASLIHDMNTPIPDCWKLQYDLVFDGGTLEHVFNFPQAIKNCMDLLRVGGHLITVPPANNYFGHGFYQFSPELFFRILAPSNGFQMKRLIAMEGNRWYDVIDPETAGRRVELRGTRDVVQLFVLAQKLAEADVLAKPPFQSDYVTEWSGQRQRSGEAGPQGLRHSVVRALERLAPRLLDRIRHVRSRDMRFHPRFFRPFVFGRGTGFGV